MTSIDETATLLAARLPELAWKLGGLYTTINANLLPRGLFKERLEITPESCIAEIRADLKALYQHKNERSAHYLAQRASQKINVLVHLCQLPNSAQDSNRFSTLNVGAITTRQQWLRELEAEIERLNSQYLALESALSNIQSSQNTHAILSIQSDLGEAKRRLTLAQETLARATRVL